jgi:hypothetical protein
MITKTRDLLLCVKKKKKKKKKKNVPTILGRLLAIEKNIYWAAKTKVPSINGLQK